MAIPPLRNSPVAFASCHSTFLFLSFLCTSAWRFVRTWPCALCRLFLFLSPLPRRFCLSLLLSLHHMNHLPGPLPPLRLFPLPPFSPLSVEVPEETCPGASSAPDRSLHQKTGAGVAAGPAVGPAAGRAGRAGRRAWAAPGIAAPAFPAQAQQS